MHGLLRSPAVPHGLSMHECGATGSASHHLVGSTSCSLACPTLQSATSLGPPAAALPRVLSARLSGSALPTGLGECFFFISLVVRLPYSSIFCQFWLFVFKLLLSFFWLCEEAQGVYLRLHLGRKPPEMPFLYKPPHKYPLDNMAEYNISCSVEYNITVFVLSLIESLLSQRP